MKKGRNSGGKNEAESRLWQHVTRNTQPYPVTKALTPNGSGRGRKPHRTPSTSTTHHDSRKTERQHRKLPLEGKLDLHGMTQEEAYQALCWFIPKAAAQGKRMLLVITGKGGPQTEGVLKRMLPLWLENPALQSHVQSIMAATPQDGGAGAFYIQLRKPIT
ncbi:MAG: Smr/MutS family protein [Proteobacteria bacterium]|nr:Smr/MutS family protein [Pseudomonadota bacterium]